MPLPHGTTGHAATDGCLADVRAAVGELVHAAPHLRPVDVAVEGVVEALHGSPVPLATMGRGLEEDTASFVAAAVAGRRAAVLGSA
ncbi:hypothetical protein [Ornithinimicrobium sp. CNJ-824]|uniref:hypothetical protein n=1 Tax=Ornithinimicrobium sp. CNJ-824 TaxID=1904966 RepID=UPI0026B990AF